MIDVTWFTQHENAHKTSEQNIGVIKTLDFVQKNHPYPTLTGELLVQDASFPRKVIIHIEFHKMTHVCFKFKFFHRDMITENTKKLYWGIFANETCEWYILDL